MPIDRDKDAEQLDRIEQMLRELHAKTEDLQALAKRAQKDASRRVAETKTVRDRVAQSRRTKPSKKR
jgi:hypothetical protein